MIVRDNIRNVLGTGSDDGSDRNVLYECRQCGTKFDAMPQRCPECESTEIAAYDLDQFDGEGCTCEGES